MPRAPTIEQQIAAIRALDLGTPDAVAVLRDALKKSIGLVVAVVAHRIGEGMVTSLVPELADCFERLCEDGNKRDPGCRGKVAIVKALHELGMWEDRVFVRGLRVSQREGPTTADDTAAELRGLCGVVHAQLVRSDALDVLAELLHDQARVTRQLAASGLGDSGRRDATALLRYKILAGDPEAEVLSACFESLFALAREDSIPFVLRCLDTHDERSEVAVLALGTARIATAVDPIRTWCMGSRPAQRSSGYLALALLRVEPATEFLLEAIRSHAKTDAIAAGRALATFADDRALAERIRAAATQQRDRAVSAEILGLLRVA